MATLAEITRETRLLLKIGAVVAVLGLLVFLIFKGGSLIQTVFFPKPPPPAEEKFGKLPDISFPGQEIAVPELSVNTVSGNLPQFPRTIKVYKLISYEPTITSLQSAKIRAANLGYTDNQQQVNSTEYRWSYPGGTNNLTYNIVNFNFNVTSDFLSSSNLSGGGVPAREDLIKRLLGFMDALNTNYSDIDFDNSPFYYYFVNGGRIIETPDQSVASLARIYMVQKQVDKLDIYYPTTDPSVLYITQSAGQNAEVVEAAYNHFAPNLSLSSTYDLKTADEALSQLKGGHGYIVSPGGGASVAITDVKLGYYLGKENDQEYLMPVIVFFGSGNFKAYVSAVKN